MADEWKRAVEGDEEELAVAPVGRTGSKKLDGQPLGPQSTIDELDLDEVQGNPGKLPLVVIAVSLVLMCAMVYVTASDARDRDDKFHPQRVALRGRWWQQYAPNPNATLPANSPFVDSHCLCATAAYATSQKRICADALAAVRATGGTSYPQCTFKVPYTAVWAAMCSSFFGFAAVAWYARSVLSQRRGSRAMHELAQIIADASLIFLQREYMWLAPVAGTLCLFIYFAVDGQHNAWKPDSSLSFLCGALLSTACGFMGMNIAVQGNVRTAAACASSKGYNGMSAGLQVAFRSGACMGIGVVSFGVFGLSATYAIFGNVTALGGFGFGASTVALFARVGGGIYTKAADVGGDLCGKVEAALDEDNPKNPATIADCVGDNVGDTAGMGADLFESFCGSIVAACVLGATEFGTHGVALPLYIATIGLVVSVFCTVHVHIPRSSDPEKDPGLHELLMALTYNIIVSGILIIAAVIALCVVMFKDEADFLSEIGSDLGQKQPGARLLGCVVCGLLAGVFIGKVTEYYTSHTDWPTQSIARSAEYGAGPVVIQGLGQGMFSTVVPLHLVLTTVLGSYYLAGTYGTAISAVGMLSTLGVTMSTDAYGPVSDNAGGIAEMVELPEWVRQSTDELDALGNTTAATGKGFSNGSAVLAAISLLAAYARVANIEAVDMLSPVVACGVIFGALQPYVFGAMTMLSVNKAAQAMMAEVRRQWNEIVDDQGRRILDEGGPLPDYEKCIAISTESSLREMLLPGLLAIFCPLIVGFTFGSHALAGFLLGAIASGYLLGVQMSNTGGAWDNAKKYVEGGGLRIRGVPRPKKTLEHAACVVGDTVGDPFKDTSGPSLNILIKLMTQFSFVVGSLLDPGWAYWWMGILLIAAFMTIATLIKRYLLFTEVPDQAFYDTPSGTPDKLDYLAQQLRRLNGEGDKIAKQKAKILDALAEQKQKMPNVYHTWAGDKDPLQAEGVDDDLPGDGEGQFINAP